MNKEYLGCIRVEKRMQLFYGTVLVNRKRNFCIKTWIKDINIRIRNGDL